MNIEKRLDELQEQLNRIEKISRQTQTQFLWFIILTLASFVLPVIGLIFLIPKFISMYSQLMQ